MSNLSDRQLQGFTIVELLVVIVVIGVLAAITIVSYNGVRDRANDVSVETDLMNMGKLVILHGVTGGAHAVDEMGLRDIGLKVSKGSYGGHLVDAGSSYKYNLLYCATDPGYSPERFAFIASSTSDKVFGFYENGVKEYPRSAWNEGWGTICPLVLDTDEYYTADGVWLYQNSTWNDWVLAK